MPPLTTPDGVLSGCGWMKPIPTSMLSVLGFVQPLHTGSRIVQGTAPVTLDSSFRYVLCLGGNGSNVSMYLPAANSTPAGFDLTIKLVSTPAFQISVYPAGADTIEGASSYDVYSPLGFITLVCDGAANWYVVNQGTQSTQSIVASLALAGGLGVFSVTPPTTQPALCVTLADVIAVLVGCGLCASS
jgi:hypothetical protein